MGKKLVLTIAMLSFLLLASGAMGSVSVGVKQGDWMEYNVTTTGTPADGHDVTWARMEVLSVQGPEISVNITTKATNGTFTSGVQTLNLELGQVGIWAIIPANLGVGEAFFEEEIGNVPIQVEEEKTFAGATRTTTYASTTERFKRWDKATGVFVEGVDTLADYNLTAKVDKTNIWSPSPTAVDSTLFYVLLAGAAVAVAAIVIIIVVRRRK